MTTQVAVRLPDDLAATLDAFIADGRVENRSSAIVGALRRELHRLLSERDIEILMKRGGDHDPELDAWVNVAAKTPFDDLG